MFELKTLEEIFRHKVFKMLLSKGKITEDLIDMLMKWRHSGFNVFCGPRIQPGEEEAMENLARYIVRPGIIRASFSQERMTYIPEESKVIYQSKDGKEEKIFDASNGWPPCVPMFPTKANRWSVTMATIVMSVAENGKIRIRTT